MKEQIKITVKGKYFLLKCDKKDGIFSNPIFLLSSLRDEEWYFSDVLKEKLQLIDWDECKSWLKINNYIITY